MCDRNKLAAVAREEAERPYNGKSDNCASNIQDIVALFPQWSVEEANGLWCAVFVYHCVILAGFKIPVRPKESSCSLAGSLLTGTSLTDCNIFSSWQSNRIPLFFFSACTQFRKGS